jgi:hypothetical protein
MSVTVRPDSPAFESRVERIPCNSEAEFGLPCSPAEPCGYCDADGLVDHLVESPAALNLSDASWRALDGALGIGLGPVGDLPASEIPDVRRAVVRALNAAPAPAVAARVEPGRTWVEGGAIRRGATIVHAGRPAGADHARLRAFAATLDAAQRANVGIVWS